MPGDSASAHEREQFFAPRRKNQVATQYFPRSRQPSAVALRAEALIDRYPNLSELELAVLINLMNRLPMLDFGLIAADDRLADRMDAFHRDHGDKLGPSLASAVVLLAIASIATLGLVLWTLG